MKELLLSFLISLTLVSCSSEPVLTKAQFKEFPNYIPVEETVDHSLSFTGKNLATDEDLSILHTDFGINQLQKLIVIHEGERLSISATFPEDVKLSQIQAMRNFVLHKFVLKNTGQIGVEPFDEWIHSSPKYEQITLSISANDQHVIADEYHGLRLTDMELYTPSIDALRYSSAVTDDLTKWIKKNDIADAENVQFKKTAAGYALVIQIESKKITASKLNALNEYLADYFANEIALDEDYNVKLIVIQIFDTDMLYQAAFDVENQGWLETDWQEVVYKLSVG